MSSNTLGTITLAVTTIFLILALVAVALRVCAKQIRERSWKAHDVLIVVAVIIEAGQVATLYTEVLVGGLGLHIGQLTAQESVVLFKGFIAHSALWATSTNLVKLSILIFYFEIFGVRSAYRRITYGCIAFVATYGVASILCVMTICRPISYVWNKTDPNGHCGNIMSAMFATAVINTFEDLTIVVLPMPLLWTLQMSAKKKLAMSAVIAVGFLVFALNVARLGFAKMTDDTDISYSLAIQAIFLNLEVQVGIINACLPTMKPLFTRRSSTRPIYSIPSTIDSNNFEYSSDRSNKVDKIEKCWDSSGDEKLFVPTVSERQLDG